MTLVIEETSKLTDKNQTTVPKAVRNALGLRPGDQIAYQVNSAGGVSLTRAGGEASAVEAFLAFLSNTIKTSPGIVRPLDMNSVEAARKLVAGVDVDLDHDFSGATPL